MEGEGSVGEEKGVPMGVEDKRHDGEGMLFVGDQLGVLAIGDGELVEESSALVNGAAGGVKEREGTLVGDFSVEVNHVKLPSGDLRGTVVSG